MRPAPPDDEVPGPRERAVADDRLAALCEGFRDRVADIDEVLRFIAYNEHGVALDVLVSRFIDADDPPRIHLAELEALAALAEPMGCRTEWVDLITCLGSEDRARLNPALLALARAHVAAEVAANPIRRAWIDRLQTLLGGRYLHIRPARPWGPLTFVRFCHAHVGVDGVPWLNILAEHGELFVAVDGDVPTWAEGLAGINLRYELVDAASDGPGVKLERAVAITRRIVLRAEYGRWPLWDGEVNVDPAGLPLSAELRVEIEAWTAEFEATRCAEDPANSGFADAATRDAWHSRSDGLATHLRWQLPDVAVFFESNASVRQPPLV